MVLVLLLTLCLANFLNYRAPDPDLYTRMAFGKYIAEHQIIPMQDPFAYTPTKPIWHDQKLIPAVLFYAVHSWRGDGALFALKLLFCFATIVCMHRAQRHLSRQRLFCYALLCAGVLGSTVIWLSTLRAQVFTYLCYAYFLCAISRRYFC